MMQVRFISPGETHVLRQQVLRPGQSLAQMEWPKDHAPGSFHLGMEANGQFCAIASFIPEGNPLVGGLMPLRLRGMATAPAHQGAGLGSALLRFGLEQARRQGNDLVWCHARERAVPFYARLGFLAQGPLFPVAGIGIHQLMHLQL